MYPYPSHSHPCRPPTATQTYSNRELSTISKPSGRGRRRSALCPTPLPSQRPPALDCGAPSVLSFDPGISHSSSSTLITPILSQRPARLDLEASFPTLLPLPSSSKPVFRALSNTNRTRRRSQKQNDVQNVCNWSPSLRSRGSRARKLSVRERKGVAESTRQRRSSQPTKLHVIRAESPETSSSSTPTETSALQTSTHSSTGQRRYDFTGAPLQKRPADISGVLYPRPQPTPLRVEYHRVVLNYHRLHLKTYIFSEPQFHHKIIWLPVMDETGALLGPGQNKPPPVGRSRAKTYTPSKLRHEYIPEPEQDNSWLDWEVDEDVLYRKLCEEWTEGVL